MGWLDVFFRLPSRNGFARQVLRGLRRAGDRRRAEYQPDEFRIQFFDEDGKPGGTCNLHNVYAEHRELPRKLRRNHLQNVVRGSLSYLKELPEDFDAARHDLRPVVRPRSFYELTLRELQSRAETPTTAAYHLLGDHLAAGLVYDLPESMRTLSCEDLESWGVTEFEAFEAAVDNLREAGMTGYAKIGEGVYSLLAGDCYNAARLLLLDFIRELEVSGNPVVIASHRDSLHITGSEDDEGLALIARLALKDLDSARPLSGIPLCLIDDDWQTWMPPDDHPAAADFALLEIRSLAEEYGCQKEILERDNERQGNDVFVASYEGIRKSDSGEVVSYCLWIEGVDSLLPRARQVVLMSNDGETAFGAADWDRLQQLAGDLLESADDAYPPRWRTLGFPDAETRTALELRPL